MTIRNDNFDAIKGYLILLVITGHLLLGTLEENGVRASIYFFHMPLFLAISGYFLKDSLLSKTIPEISRKYWTRLVIPYLVAFTAYTIISWQAMITDDSLDLKKIAHSILYPYYHLWYVPAILAYIAYTKIIFNSKWLIISVALASAVLTIAYESPTLQITEDHPLLKMLGDKRFYCLYLYFIVGHLYIHIKAKPWLFEIAILAITPLLIVYNYSPPSIVSSTAKILANLCFIFITLKACESIQGIKLSLASQIGKISLPIYLWHVIPIMLMHRIFSENTTLYYAGSVTTITAMIIVMLKIEGRHPFTDKWIFGVPKQRTA